MTSGVETMQVDSFAMLGSYPGKFRVQYKSLYSKDIQYDATADEFEIALQALSSLIGQVNVTVLERNSYGGRTWNVTFQEGSNEIRRLGVDVSDLYGPGEKIRFINLVNEKRIPLSGNFTLSTNKNNHGRDY